MNHTSVYRSTSTSLIPLWLELALCKEEPFTKADFNRLGKKEDQKEYLVKKFPKRKIDINSLPNKKACEKFAEQMDLFTPKEKMSEFKKKELI